MVLAVAMFGLGHGHGQQEGPTRVLDGHLDVVSDLAFSPDDRYIATASDDERVLLWDLTTALPATVLVGHKDWVTAVVFTPDGAKIVSGDRSGDVCVWQVPGGSLLQRFQCHGDWVTALVPSGDSERIYIAGDGGWLDTYDLGSGKRLHARKAHDGMITDMKPCLGGRFIVSAGEQPSLAIIDTVTFAVHPLIKDTEIQTRSLAVSPDGGLAVVGDSNGNASTWDLKSRKMLSQIRSDKRRVNAVAISPDSRLVAVSNLADRAVSIRQLPNLQEFCRFDNQATFFYDLTFSPDSKFLAAAGRDSNVYIIDAASCARLKVCVGHGERVVTIRFSHSGTSLASTSWDHTARIWHADGMRARMGD